MTESDLATPPQDRPQRGLRWPQVLAVVVVTVVLTAGLTIWLVRTYVFPAQFAPVTLTAQEQQRLDEKLEKLDSHQVARDPAAGLRPEAYSEDPAARIVTFTERELNAILANNTDLADRVALDLSEKLVSAKILVPMDEDFPVLGGRVLRIKTGIMFDYQQDKPVVKLKGVSMMGVPLPSAWLGGLKNIDLVAEFGDEAGFWKSFAEGVADIQVKDGQLQVQLKE
jgi:hypothetical protein